MDTDLDYTPDYELTDEEYYTSLIIDKIAEYGPMTELELSRFMARPAKPYLDVLLRDDVAIAPATPDGPWDIIGAFKFTV